jgi:CBS domain containing-hemolysin-like protein
MEPSVYILILLIILILVGSACCSGAEAAFLAVNSIRILELASKQKPKSSANQLLKLRKHLGRTLTVITITNNGFNIIGSLLLGVYGAFIIKSSLGLTLFSIVFYVLVVLLGEVLPKALGTRFSLQIAMFSVPILRMLNSLMRPFLLLIEQLFPVITAENEISTDEAEIRQMAKIGSQKGFIEADEAAMILKVFQLNDLKAKDLMIPRVSAPSLDGSSNLDEISKLIISNNSPWWVVLGDKVDKIQGIAKR